MQPLLPGVAPDQGQQEIGDHVSKRAVGQDVIDRSSKPVGEAGRAKKREGSVDFAGQQQEDEDPAEAAPAHRPLLEVHFSPGAGDDAQQQGGQRGERDQGQCRGHGASSRFAGSIR